jgi:hypothetical protein
MLGNNGALLVGEEDKDKVLEERNRKQGILPFDFFFVYGEGGK